MIQLIAISDKTLEELREEFNKLGGFYMTKEIGPNQINGVRFQKLNRKVEE